MAKKPLSKQQRERMRAYHRQWERDHRDERNKQQRERYWADPEKAREAVAERQRKLYWKDPEKARARYWANREKAREKARAKYRAAKAGKGKK
jgi:hypothetical protein